MHLLYDFDLNEKQKSQALNVVYENSLNTIDGLGDKLFIVDENGTGEVLGFMNLRLVEHKSSPFVSVSYIYIKEKSRNRHVGTNAIFYLLNELKLKNVLAYVDNTNTRSKKMFVRNGFLKDYDTNYYFKIS